MPGEVEWILDVAHNVPAAEILRDNLRRLPTARRTVAICGILGDKDIRGITATLAAQIDAWIPVTLAGPRAVGAEQIAQQLPTSASVLLRAGNVAEACRAARAATHPQDRVLVFGSFLTVGTGARIPWDIVRVMESRAKQRLTGAIILVALFVLLVPELLTGPRDAHPETQGASDEGMRRYTIDLDTQRAAAAPAAPSAEPAVKLPPVATATEANPTRAVPGEAAAAAPVTTPTAPAQHSVAPVAAAVTSPPQAAHGEPARVEPPRQDTPNRIESGSYAVQLGTFGKRGKRGSSGTRYDRERIRRDCGADHDQWS